MEYMRIYEVPQGERFSTEEDQGQNPDPTIKEQAKGSLPISVLKEREKISA